MQNNRTLWPLVAALAWVVTVAAGLVLGLSLTHNLNSESTPLIVTLLGFAGSIVTVVLLSVQAMQNANGINQLHGEVNSHLTEHTNLEGQITQVLQDVATGSPPSSPPAPPPAGPPPPGSLTG